MNSVTTSGFETSYICLFETWLRLEVPDSMVRISGYNLVRNDRVGRRGGGVAFYIRDSIGAVVLERLSGDSQHRKPEFLTAEIIFKNARKLLLAVVYRPPNCGYHSKFMDIFQDLQTSY